MPGRAKNSSCVSGNAPFAIRVVRRGRGPLGECASSSRGRATVDDSAADVQDRRPVCASSSAARGQRPCSGAPVLGPSGDSRAVVDSELQLRACTSRGMSTSTGPGRPPRASSNAECRTPRQLVDVAYLTQNALTSGVTTRRCRTPRTHRRSACSDLPGDADERGRVHRGVRDRGHEVRRPGPEVASTTPPGPRGACVALRHVAGAPARAWRGRAAPSYRARSRHRSEGSPRRAVRSTGGRPRARARAEPHPDPSMRRGGGVKRVGASADSGNVVMAVPIQLVERGPTRNERHRRNER